MVTVRGEMPRGISGKGFRQALKRAFAVPAEEPLTEQQRQWMDKLARKVVARGLTVPAILLLESIQPLGFVGSQAVVFFKPIISLVFRPEFCDEVARLLEKRSALRDLMQMIERCDAEARAAETSKGADQ